MMARTTNWLCALVLAALAGCASSGARAPVSEPGANAGKPAALVSEASAATKTPKAAHLEPGAHAETYIVQKGDTLMGIAFSHDIDYHDIIALNNLQNPDLIQVGQELRLVAPTAAAAPKPAAATETRPAEIPVMSQPVATVLPYSATAVAEIEKMQQAPQPKPAATAPAAAQPVPAAAAAVAPPAASENASGSDELEWGMPTEGKLLAGFSESANQKGIDIAGKPGQPVVASAAGRVVYSGSGLRGYGKLVIIKHNNTYLSAYAHNDQILVKEGQMVTRGQKIAEMGNTDADQVKLHFEIRKQGKPVDPAKYLPLIKS
jgi:lipoprotein NlpD